MDYLWSPWRFHYVSRGNERPVCIFCELSALDPTQDRERLILHRGRHNLMVLNLFPYTTGHVMIAPYAHVPSLAGLDREVLAEMMVLTQKIEEALKSAYRPEGYNMGMNLGRSAGAGIADHLHLHFLPRWTGDTNFMTVVGETRVHPEELRVTYDKLATYFRDGAAPRDPADKPS